MRHRDGPIGGLCDGAEMKAGWAMNVVLKLVLAAALAVIVSILAVVLDLGWNRGAMLARLSGRDALVRECTPPLQRRLTEQGFTPEDIALGGKSAVSALSGSFGRSRTLASSFTFADGANGPRVDGRFVCTIDRTVTIQVEVDQLPRRVT